MEENFIDITSNKIINNNHITFQNIYNNIVNPKYAWINNPTTGMFNSTSNVIELNIFGVSELIIEENNIIASNIISTNLIGSGYQLSNINLNNIINIPELISSNEVSNIVSFYISSNNLKDQNYINSNTFIEDLKYYISSNILSKQELINSNSIHDIISFLISSNNLYDQQYINSNSIQDIISFYISSNNLKDQNYINSNSIEDIYSFIISSNVLNKQNYINSNSIIDITNFYISSNNLYDQNYINSNSIEDIISFVISSNILNIQNYINSNSIDDIISFLISSNNLIDQRYINSNEIIKVFDFYISSNLLNKQNYINSNSIEDITSFIISSNILNKQNYINSNSITDIISFYLNSNLLSVQNYINSNSIEDIISFLISSNNLIDQRYINSNSIQDIKSFLISSNILNIQNYNNSNTINDITLFIISSNLLNKQNYINSNSIEDLISYFISSNNLKDQKYINSNSINDIILYYISSNILDKQNYINSNSIQDLLGFYISSNNLIDQKYNNSNSIQDLISFYISSNILNIQNYINSNSVQDLLEFYISSNNLIDQKYINSNSIENILSFIISSNNLYDQKYINSNSFEDITSFLISSNLLNKQNYINSNSITDIITFLISSNNLYDQKYMNSNSIEDIISFIISSNLLNKQNYINSNSITDITSFYISSNNLIDQKYINSNSIEDIISFIISSNNLSDQRYINSNSITDILSYYISSNNLIDQKYINSNSIEDIVSFLITSNNLSDQRYINSNSIIDIISFLISSNNLIDQKYINSNSIEDIVSFIITSNNLSDQRYINSNSIEDIISFYISSNNLIDQRYINSNTIIELVEFIISSNLLNKQNYINSNSIKDITSFIVSSNLLNKQNYINSNSIEDIISYYITSNNLIDQRYINSNSITEILDYYISSNIVNYFILNNNFLDNVSFSNILEPYYNYVTDNSDIIKEGIHNKFIVNNIYNNNLTVNGDIIASNLFILGTETILNTTTYQTNQLNIINSNNNPALIVNQTGINKDTAYFYNSNSIVLSITSNGNVGIGLINPSVKLEVIGDIIGSNIIAHGSNITNIKWDNLIDIPPTLTTSNTLSSQYYLNSNSFSNILLPYVGCNILSPLMFNYGFIHSNNIAVLNSNLGFDTIQQRNVAINSLIYNAPLYKTSNIINFNIDPLRLQINANNELTLSSNVVVEDNTLTFKFNLLQSNITYPNLWYYQLKISDYSKTFLIDNYEYNVFKLTSWSGPNVDVMYDSLILVTNKNGGVKEIKYNTEDNNIISSIIDLGDGNITTEGWQLDSDINYMTWYSKTPKTIYNILVDQIRSSNITNYNYINTLALFDQSYINSNYITTTATNYITCNVLDDILLPYLNLNTNGLDTIKKGVNNKYIIKKVYDNDLNINGSITASNLYILGSNTVYNTITNNFSESLKIENFDTGTALIVNQILENNNIAEFYKSNNIALVITSNNNVGIGLIDPNASYKLEIIGTINATELIGDGKNISNINWDNVINISPYYITSNILNDLLIEYLSSNVLSNYINQGYICGDTTIKYLNSNYGFDNTELMITDLNLVNNQVTNITDTIVSNLLYKNNILQNNFGIITNTYTSTVNFDVTNGNSFIFYDNDISSLTPLTINGNYVVEYNSGKSITYKVNNISYQYSSLYPVIHDSNNNIIVPALSYQCDGLTTFLNDSSGNNNNLTAYNGATYSSNAIMGFSLGFNASQSNYYKIPTTINISSIQNAYGITISFWARISTSVQDNAAIFEFGELNTTKYISIYITPQVYGTYGSITFKISNVTGNTSYNTVCTNGDPGPVGCSYWTYLKDNLYHYYTWIISPNGESTIYIDSIKVLDPYGTSGQLYSMVFTTPGYIINNKITIDINKAYYYLGKSNNNSIYFDGNIEDFRIYSEMLSYSQITELFKLPGYNANTIIKNNINGTIISPTLLYTFNNTLNDSSGNNYNLTAYNGLSYTSNSVMGDTCLEFKSANNNYGTITGSLNIYNIQTTTGITFAYWFKFKTGTTTDAIYQFGSGSSIFAHVRSNPNSYLRFINGTGNMTLYGTADGNWHHVVITMNTTNVISVWLDGIYYLGEFIEFNVNKNGSWGLLPGKKIYGNLYNGGTYNFGNIGIFSSYFNGYLDDFRIYPFTFNQSAVNTLYYANNNINRSYQLTTSLVSYNYIINTNFNYPNIHDFNSIVINPDYWYKFDVITGMTYNSSGDTNLWYTTGKNPSLNYNNSRGTSSVYYNGSKFLYGSATISNMSFSISLWIYIFDINDKYILSFGSDMTTQYKQINISILNGYYQFDFGEGGFSSLYPATTDINSWIHLVFTYDINTNYRLIYKNNILIGTNIAINTPLCNTMIFTIGIQNYNATKYFKGYMDDLRIYKNLVLNESQINELYTGCSTVYSYANNGPLFVNSYTNNIGIGTQNPPFPIQVNGDITSTEFSGSGTLITTLNFNNIINKPTIINNILNKSVITTIVLSNQPYINYPTATAQYLSSNTLNTSEYVSSNLLTSIISTYNTQILNQNYLTSNNLNNYIITNPLLNNTSNNLLFNNYGLKLTNCFTSNNIFNINNINYNSNIPLSSIDNNSYLYFNDNKTTLTSLPNSNLYNIQYNNGTSILSYYTTLNITQPIISITNGIIFTTSNIYIDVYDSNNTIINPTAWYKFDNDGLTIDASGNNNTLTAYNTPTFSGKNLKGNNGLYLNGSSQYLSTSINLTSISFTITFWAYLLSTSGNWYIGCGSSLATSNVIEIGINSGNYCMAFYNDNLYASSPPVINDVKKWTYLTFTFNATTHERKIYRNGIIIAQDISLYTPILSSVFNIGQILNTGYINAYYDDVRLYRNVILTQSQIQQLYNPIYIDNQFTITSNNSYPNVYDINSNIINPLSWYKFDDNILLDSGLNNNTLVSYNEPIIIENGAKGSNCILLNGINQNLETTLNYNTNNTNLSISTWIYPKYTSSNNCLLSFGNMYFGIYDNYYYNTTNLATNDINNWIHIAITYNINNNIQIIYKNCVIISSNISTLYSLDNTSLIIGSKNNMDYWNGNIDDFRIYNTVLNYDQIIELYTGRITVYNYYNNGPLYINYLTKNVGINKLNAVNTLDINGNIKATEYIGIGSNLININWNNITNAPEFINDVLSSVSSNILSNQNYINSNSIQDLIPFYITSNNLSEQQLINSNSIQDLLSFYITSNNLSEQQLINSNSIQDLLSFYISSNNLYDQQLINSNSIQDLLSFYITSNNLYDQQLINSNSIQDLLSFYITSNNLSEQQLINSNSIQDLLSFYISSNNLYDQNYINSNSIQDIISFYITSNNLSEQQLINSNSIQDLLLFYITSNNLSEQQYINSNSITDIISFYISSNNLYDQQLINSNSIEDLLSFYISSNNLSEQQLINSNSIQDIISFYITSNNLSEQQYINSNSIQDIILNYVSLNNLSEQQLINSNSIENILEFYVSSNNLIEHQYINSNSIQDLISFYITSNNLLEQQYINSNSIQDIISFYISSNNLYDQQLINSNSIQDIISFYISSNNLYDQQFINSNSIEDITSVYSSIYISSNILYEQKYINSNSIEDITSFIVSSNILNTQQYINSNSIQNIYSFFINSNILNYQNYINSNTIINIYNPIISSNVFHNTITKYISSNTLNDVYKTINNLSNVLTTANNNIVRIRNILNDYPKTNITYTNATGSEYYTYNKYNSERWSWITPCALYMNTISFTATGCLNNGGYCVFIIENLVGAYYSTSVSGNQYLSLGLITFTPNLRNADNSRYLIGAGVSVKFVWSTMETWRYFSVLEVSNNVACFTVNYDKP